MILIGTPHTRNAGYFMNDDRNSGGTKAEADIQTCPHCQCIIKMQEWRKAPIQNFCIKCMRPACNDKRECLDCMPFMQKIDRYCDALIKFEQHLKVAGLDPAPPKPSLILPG